MRVITRHTSPASSVTKSAPPFVLMMRGICHTRSSRPAAASDSSFSWQWSVMLCMFRMMTSGCVNTARLTFCTTTWVSVNVLRNTARNVSLMLPLPNGTIVTRRPLTLNLLTSNASSMAFPSGGV